MGLGIQNNMDMGFYRSGLSNITLPNINASGTIASGVITDILLTHPSGLRSLSAHFPFPTKRQTPIFTAQNKKNQIPIDKLKPETLDRTFSFSIHIFVS